MTSTKMNMQRYADATLHDLVRIVAAAEAFYCIMSEFPDEPEYWENELQMFDIALEACPGTNAYQHKEFTKELIKP